MDRRDILLLLATACLALVVALELGAGFVLSAPAPAVAEIESAMEAEGIGGDEREEALEQLDEVAAADDPPGLAIPFLALIDGPLLLTVAALSLASVVPHRIMSRVVAPANLVVSFLIILGGIVAVLVTLALLLLMVGLFLSVPFGTVTYLVRWGFFPRGEAQALLGLLLLLKLGFVCSALAASFRLLKNKGLVALTITSFLLQWIIGFLHALVPLPLVSMFDVLAALLVLIVAIIWAIVMLVGSLIGTVRLIRVRSN